MKRLWMVMTSALVVVAGCASTQSPSIGVTPRPGVDTKPHNTVEVLRADDKVVTRVEKPNKVSPASQPVRVAQADTRTSKKMSNGWVITVYPWGQEAMVGRFVQPTPSPIKIAGHESLISKGTPVIFKGQSIFVAEGTGKYVFILKSIVKKSYEEYIFANLSINGKKVLNINSREKKDHDIWFQTDGIHSAAVTKAIELSKGEYNIGFEFGARRRTRTFNPNLYTLEILVIEPGASQPRHLRPQQVIHYRN